MASQSRDFRFPVMAPYAKATGHAGDYLVNIVMIGHPANSGYPGLGAEVWREEHSWYVDNHWGYEYSQVRFRYGWSMLKIIFRAHKLIPYNSFEPPDFLSI